MSNNLNEYHFPAGDENLYIIKGNSDVDDRAITPLHLAVRNNDIETVTMLLNKGANVNAEDEYGMNPLHIAAKNNLFLVAKILLEFGAYVDSYIEYGTKDADIKIGFYLSRSSSSSSSSNTSSTLPYSSFSSSCLNHSLHYPLPTTFSLEEFTPLHLAVYNNNEKLVELFLRNGASVDAKTMHGQTPLHFAALWGFHRLVEILLNRNADIHSKDIKNGTPLNFATVNNQVKTIKLLLERGADVNAKGRFGYTPLHIACEENLNEAVDILLEYEADINVVNNYRCTPILLAAYKQHKEIVKILLNIGDAVNVQNEKGETLLHQFIGNVEPSIYELLLEFDIDVNARTKDDQTPIMYAAKCMNENMCRILLNRGANINASDNKGLTALHYVLSDYPCARCKDENVVKFLLMNDADPNCKCNMGITPLHLAARIYCRREIQDYIDFGANVNVTDNDGRTPLDWAVEINNFRIAVIIKEHLIKMQVAGLYLSDKNIKYIESNTDKENQDEYMEEILRMKTSKLGNTDVSFYDVLMEHKIKSPSFYEDEKVLQIFKSSNYKTIYPHYGNLLALPIKNLLKEFKRRILINGAHQVSSSFNNFKKLPYECAEKIFSYLSDEDLKIFEDIKYTKE